VRHLFLAEEWETATQVVEEFGLEKVVRGDGATVSEWIQSFPSAIVESHPLLCIIYIWAHKTGHSGGERLFLEDYLHKAQRLVSSNGSGNADRLVSSFVSSGMLAETIPDPSFDLDAIKTSAQGILEQLAENDLLYSAFALTLAFAHAARYEMNSAQARLQEGKRTALANGGLIDVASAGYYEARFALDTGHLQRAVRICHQEEQLFAALLAQERLESSASGWLDIINGSLLLEQDFLDEAEKALTRGVANATLCDVPHFHVDGLTELFRLRMAQRRYDEALGCLQQIQEYWPDYGFLAEALRLKLQLETCDNPLRTDRPVLLDLTFSPLRGNAATPPSAKAPLRPPMAAPHLPGLGPLGGSTAYFQAYLAWARIQTLSGRPDAALAYVNAHLDLLETQGIQGRALFLSVEKALALDALGQSRAAADVVRQALEKALPEGYLRVFDGGPRLNRLLVKAASNRALRDYAELLLQRFDEQDDAAAGRGTGGGDTSDSSAARQQDAWRDARPKQYPAARTKALFQFTRREGEILELVIAGLSNKDIAHTLHLEISTVKTHMSHIMRKLGVTSRTQAILQAQKSGFLV
jgi:LuxR family maltose regulon positive regulatory protein